MLRSTVPLGTTRKVVIPYIEKNTNLKAGLDFFVAFTPERTIEGNALNELKSLPQIVGGYSKKCLLEARNFWSKISKTIVSVNSLEAAEMVKLINNTFRDVSFSFANEVALKCDEFNINCFELIKAANEQDYELYISASKRLGTIAYEAPTSELAEFTSKMFDIFSNDNILVGCEEMGNKIIEELEHV